MKYDRNKIKDIFRDGISCLYLDEKDDLEEELENTDDKIDEFYIRKDIRQL